MANDLKVTKNRALYMINLNVVPLYFLHFTPNNISGVKSPINFPRRQQCVVDGGELNSQIN